MTPEPVITTIAVFSPLPASWRWYSEDSLHTNWVFYTEEPQTWLERTIKQLPLGRIFGAFRCVRGAQRDHAIAIAAHSQNNTMWSAVALRLLSSSTPLLSFSFHFSHLPTGLRLLLAKWAFTRVARFGVHSEPERMRYSRHFDLPIERFDLIRWGVQPTSIQIEEAPPPVIGPYICAMGKDGRDYRTLVEAMRQLPDLTLVLVAQPYNLAGVEIPENVKVFCDVPREEALNILKHSQFMALPLEDNDTSCGHITIVSAMFCRKAIVATGSSGIADYFPVGYDAPQPAAGDVASWVVALQAMAGDLERRERCADTGEQFAHQYCSHNAAYRGTMDIFRRAGVSVD
jgi:glycosyltransferase involved in cell wall biosynthesis